MPDRNGRAGEGMRMTDLEKRLHAARWEIDRAFHLPPDSVIFDRAMNRDGYNVIVLLEDGTYRRSFIRGGPLEDGMIAQFGVHLQEVVNELMVPRVEGVTV